MPIKHIPIPRSSFNDTIYNKDKQIIQSVVKGAVYFRPGDLIAIRDVGDWLCGDIISEHPAYCIAVVKNFKHIKYCDIRYNMVDYWFGLTSTYLPHTYKDYFNSYFYSIDIKIHPDEIVTILDFVIKDRL
jgi:hypothetical protein